MPGSNSSMCNVVYTPIRFFFWVACRIASIKSGGMLLPCSPTPSNSGRVRVLSRNWGCCQLRASKNRVENDNYLYVGVVSCQASSIMPEKRRQEPQWRRQQAGDDRIKRMVPPTLQPTPPVSTTCWKYRSVNIYVCIYVGVHINVHM